jgi:hypothetical protein
MLLSVESRHQGSETSPYCRRRSCLLVGGGGTGTTHDTQANNKYVRERKMVPTYQKERSNATGQVGSPPFRSFAPLGSWPASAEMDATRTPRVPIRENGEREENGVSLRQGCRAHGVGFGWEWRGLLLLLAFCFLLLLSFSFVAGRELLLEQCILRTRPTAWPLRL